MSEGVQRYSRIYGKVGTMWPKALLDARSVLVKRLTASRRVQGSINFAAERFPSGQIQRIDAPASIFREDVPA
ncbi:MAG: monooxygenase [Pseudarthrobacter sp.]|nr:monooxygenase [Pseudarthrobacter sp.]